jgi:type IV pilus assembly protein PilV
MKKTAGFTLIEVLIAMLVLAVGLLGLAALQATSLKNNQSAYNRSQATQLAYDMADRIRANNTATALAVYTTILPSAATTQADCTSVSTTCTAADMATNDLKEWDTTLKTLPSGEGIVCFDSTPNTSGLPVASGASVPSATAAGCDGAGTTYAIKLWWNDGGVSKQIFAVSFQL